MQNKRIIFVLFLLLAISTLAFQGVSGSPSLPSSDAPGIKVQATPDPIDEQFTPGAPPLSLTVTLACMCLAFLGVLGVIVLGIFVRRGNMDMESDSPKE